MENSDITVRRNTVEILEHLVEMALESNGDFCGNEKNDIDRIGCQCRIVLSEIEGSKDCFGNLIHGVELGTTICELSAQNVGLKKQLDTSISMLNSSMGMSRDLLSMINVDRCDEEDMKFIREIRDVLYPPKEV